MISFDPRAEFANLELEDQLLTALEATPGAWRRLTHLLSKDTFAAAEHQQAFEAIVAEGDQEPAVLSDPELAALTSMAAELAEAYQKSQLVALQQQVAQTLYRERATSIDDLLQTLQTGVEDIRRQRSRAQSPLTFAADVLPAITGLVDQWREASLANQKAGFGAITGIPTGFRHLDEILNGLNNRLYLLSAMPGSGKTQLASLIGYQVAKHGWPVVYVTYGDNTKEGLVLKHVCRLARVPSGDVEKGRVPSTQLQPAIRQFAAEAASRFAIVEASPAVTHTAIRQFAEDALKRGGASRGLIVVDYLQKMAHAYGGSEPLREKVDAISQHLANIAHSLDCPVLAISSQNRAGYSGGKQSTAMESLRESGNLEFDADAIMILREPEAPAWTPPPEWRPRELVVVKNRFGAIGTLPFDWNGALGDYTEVDNRARR